MQDAGIVRNRAEDRGRGAARRAPISRSMEKGPGFSALLWDFLDGKPKVNHFRSTKQVPAETALSRQMSKELRRPRLQVRRPDHRLRLHAGGRHGQRPSGRPATATRRAEARAAPWLPRRSAPVGRARPTPRRAPGSACCRAAGSTCSIPRRSTSRSRTSPTASRAWRAGTARPSGAHIFSVAQHSLLVEAIARYARRGSTAGSRLAVLLHDAPEYVIGDMISPFKAVIGDDYKAVEARLLAAIHLRFGLPASPAGRAHRADQGGRPQRGLSRGDPARGLFHARRRSNSSAGRPSCRP